MAAEAFQVYATESPRLIRTFGQMLDAEIAKESAAVASGAAQDWGNYRERVGVIRGLTTALNILKLEVDKEDRHGARQTA